MVSVSDALVAASSPEVASAVMRKLREGGLDDAMLADVRGAFMDLSEEPDMVGWTLAEKLAVRRAKREAGGTALGLMCTNCYTPPITLMHGMAGGAGQRMGCTFSSAHTAALVRAGHAGRHSGREICVQTLVG